MTKDKHISKNICIILGAALAVIILINAFIYVVGLSGDGVTPLKIEADYANAAAHKVPIQKINSLKGNEFSVIGIQQDIYNKEDVSEPIIDIQPTKFGIKFNSKVSTEARVYNTAIFDICSSNFIVSINDEALSPLYPMALANNETGIRADPNLTFSSLYPSAVVYPETVQSIYEFSCINVLSSSDVFTQLAGEWWTRDRGPVQMNADYGARNNINALSEQELLAGLSIPPYTAPTTKEGLITAEEWVSRAATTPGDRFNIKDVCSRLSSELNYALDVINSNYSITDSRHAIILLSMYHGAGSLWNSEYKSTEIGYWVSGEKAYEYASILNQDEVADFIYNKAKTAITLARQNNKAPEIGLSTTNAYSVYVQLMQKGYLSDISTYTANGTYQKDYITYPIKLLYNYAMLVILYQGG